MLMTTTCRNCGSEVSSHAPFGHCPACLIRLGFGPIPEAAEIENGKPGKTRLFGDYELIEQIGRGGMGVVYKARQMALNRLVALKMILAGELASAASVERFQIEAEAAANLHHPNIVPIYEIGEHGGNHYFSMKLVEGESLAKMMTEFALPKPSKTSLPKAVLRQAHSQIARFMAAVARATDYAHKHGILHRDLKPGNILMDAEGTPYLTDFGLAKITSRGDSVTESGDIIGSLSYMAPEQAQGNRVSEAADIYSLGAIFYELLTGKPPFRAETPLETLRQLSEQEPEKPRALNRLVDVDLATICLKCLEKDPQRRYASAADLADDLDRWERFEPIRARRTTIPVRVQRWTRRNRTGTALIIALCLGFTTALFLLHRTRVESERRESANRIILNEITRNIESVWEPQPYVEISSEALAVITGNSTYVNRLFPQRLTVGVFIQKSPAETLTVYPPLIDYLEQSVNRIVPHSDIAFSFRIYRNMKGGINDLAAGRVDVIQVPAQIYLLVQQKNPDVKVLVTMPSEGREGVIFCRADSGITNLAGLKGKSLAFSESNHVATILAKARLVEAGLCLSDFGRVHYANDVINEGLRVDVDELEMLDQGGYSSSKSASMRGVLGGEFNAGVALDNSYFKMNAWNNFNVLARFHYYSKPWVARAGLSPALVNALTEAMIELKEKRILEPLPDTPDRSLQPYQVARDEDYNDLRLKLQLARAFDAGTTNVSHSTDEKLP